MKYTAIFFLLFSLGLFACSNVKTTPAPGDVQTAIAQSQTAASKTKPTESPIPATPTPTPAPVVMATSTPRQDEPDNIATVVAHTGPHFDFAEISGVAHLDNGYFLITIEVPGGVRGEYQALIGEEQFKCLVLAEYPNRLYCTGLTSQAGQFVVVRVYELGAAEPVFEEELGIPPLPPTDSIQARIRRETRDRPKELPPADSSPYPYP